VNHVFGGGAEENSRCRGVGGEIFYEKKQRDLVFVVWAVDGGARVCAGHGAERTCLLALALAGVGLGSFKNQ